MTDSKVARYRSDVTVQFIKGSASDEDVLFAARVSTVGETHKSAYAEWAPELNYAHDIGAGDSAQAVAIREKVDQGSKRLVNYLMRDRHGSPFEHTSFTFYVQAPIFVFREFMRHRIASYNEESGRYKELEGVFYIPAAERNLVQQGKAGAYVYVPGTPEQLALVEEVTKRANDVAYASYQEMLEAGIAREVARIPLPLNIYSSMYVTMNARALMNFLSLRTKREGSHFPSFPQREIEMVAEKMEADFERLMPWTYEAFNKNGRVAP